jgi:small subunit ribosomal protein S20
MPNIKSVMKNDIKSKRQNLVNKAAKSALKTDLKKFDAAVAAGDHDAAVSTYKTAVKAVDRAASKGLIHKNKAAHRKSAMAQKMNQLG